MGNLVSKLNDDLSPVIVPRGVYRGGAINAWCMLGC